MVVDYADASQPIMMMDSTNYVAVVLQLALLALAQLYVHHATH